MNDGGQPKGATAAQRARELPTYSARELTSGGQLAAILLDDQLYTLRITKAGKLILTK